jgi:hypothetical protein
VKLKDLTIDDVMSVYSGLPGCACGCRGKHRYASKHVKIASKNRGYKVQPEEISDRSVAIIFGKVKRNADKLEYSEHEDFFSVELGNRTLVVYPLPSTYGKKV